jgi:hypothetical protein
LVKPLDALRLRRAADAILAGGVYTEGLAADAGPVEPMVPCPTTAHRRFPRRPNQPRKNRRPLDSMASRYGV